MFCLHRPDQCQARDYLAYQAERKLSYPTPGLTSHFSGSSRVAGWSVDHHRVPLGCGDKAFARARAAIESWKMFPDQITTVFGQERPRLGLTVAVSFHASPFPLWLLMP